MRKLKPVVLYNVLGGSLRGEYLHWFECYIIRFESNSAFVPSQAKEPGWRAIDVLFYRAQENRGVRHGFRQT